MAGNSSHTVEYRGFALTWREHDDQWHCYDLALFAKSFTALKEKVRKETSQERRMADVEAVIVREPDRGYSVTDEGLTIKVSMIVQEKGDRPAAMVWINKPKGNSMERSKATINSLCLPTPENLDLIKQAKGIEKQAKALYTEANEKMKKVKRLTMEEIAEISARNAGAE